MTTNSASGITSFDDFFPVFAAMEKHDLVLNLHGEVPSNPGSDITDLTAEEAFLPTLVELNQRFPKLRIVLEHCSTAAAIAAVRACGPSVVGKLPSQITALIMLVPFLFEMKTLLPLCLPARRFPAQRRFFLPSKTSEI